MQPSVSQWRQSVSEWSQLAGNRAEGETNRFSQHGLCLWMQSWLELIDLAYMRKCFLKIFHMTLNMIFFFFFWQPKEPWIEWPGYEHRRLGISSASPLVRKRFQAVGDLDSCLSFTSWLKKYLKHRVGKLFAQPHHQYCKTEARIKVPYSLKSFPY